MANNDKKKAKLKAKIEELEQEMKLSLSKKVSDKKEISLNAYQKRLDILRTQLAVIK